MKVILKKRVPNLGHEWDMVTVKRGYARNFLLPQDLAMVATSDLMKQSENQVKNRVKKMEEAMENAKETIEKLSKITLHFKMKSKGKKLYGSITEKDIVDALLKEHKIELSKEMIKMKEHLKALGDHKVKIHLAEGVEAGVAVKVEAEEKKAEEK